jgi:hypothetical protein
MLFAQNAGLRNLSKLDMMGSMDFSKVDKTCTPQLRMERLKRRMKIERRRPKRDGRSKERQDK